MHHDNKIKIQMDYAERVKIIVSSVTTFNYA